MDKAINEQRSVEWVQERLGRFTASEIFKLMTDPKSKAAKDAGELSEGAKTYVLDKVAEILTGESPEISTWEMAWGITNEPLARKWFVKLTKNEVEENGFQPYGQHAGGSADGITERGILEIKAPANSTNHVKHLLINSPEYFKDNFPAYYYQMQANMLFNNKSMGYFVSFDPRMDNDHGFFVFEMDRNEDDCKAILTKIEAAVKYKESILESIKQSKEIAA